MKQTTLILFSRFPEAGKTKTRLIPVLGAQGAAALQKKLTEQAAAGIRKACELHACTAEIHYAGADKAAMRDWLGDHFSYYRQQGDGLGKRMEAAIAGAFSRGARQVLLTGGDCPAVTTPLIARALHLLGTSDLVFSPTFDGGYFLVGVNQDGHVQTDSSEFPAQQLKELQGSVRPHRGFCDTDRKKAPGAPWAAIFRDIPWGTATVLLDSLRQADALGLLVSLTPGFPDIDRPDDLVYLRHYPDAG